MATTIEELEFDIRAAIVGGFRDRLLARGEARSMIWREGQLPPGSPVFAQNLSYELFSYSYSLLGMGLRLRARGGDQNTARLAFEHAAMSLEAILNKGSREDDARSFHYVIAAAAYHLGRFSARAYSLLSQNQDEESFSPIERCLRHLMLRDLRALENEFLEWRIDGPGTDRNIAATLEEKWGEMEVDGPLPEGDEDSYVADALGQALIDNFLSGIALFLVAVERSERVFIDQAIERLRSGLEVCAEVNLLQQWWAYRLAMHIIEDLWSSSFHERLPLLPNNEDEIEWARLRRLFIALIYSRSRAEIDLWPSQLEAAAKAVNETEDLVVSLPTSAGKTRIAELCILRCLAAGKRVIFVTPLRALSAQTEASLQRTFIPLGKSISTLYGSIGTSGFEEDAFQTRNIVVSTPEKLDFALRNDPNLINDVGLVVLDEGHMIGLGEREVRYEVQIQRLLNRDDADSRRIVCLSAILPEGEQLDDFVDWLRQDGNGCLIESKWRPTRLRFGEVIWANGRARLNIRVGDERPFVPGFLRTRGAPLGRRQRPFPDDQRELVLATTWRLAEDGQSVLIYCPERRSVEPYAKAIAKLNGYGLLNSLIGDAKEHLSIALSIGKEWLGEDHPVLKCLELGVAIHHGALPTPFRKEVERLLRNGVLKITVSSPTLAQGLNLSATTIVLHGIIRNQHPIDASEFKNVAGRAGRAFVDVEGLVLFPFFQPHALRRAQWEALKEDDAGREMESGLLRLVITLLRRMRLRLGGIPYDQLVEYVMNNAQAWSFPELPNETPEVSLSERRQWDQHLATLDTAILSLMGEEEVAEDEVELRLDQVLSSSLWERRLHRRVEELQHVYKSALHGRARFLWQNTSPAQRRSYFLAGVGYETGRQLDQLAAEVNFLLVQANGAILVRDNATAIAAITSLAERLFVVSPFIPNPLPDNWHDILKAWLNGAALAELSDDEDVLRFVENGLIYKLPWGMEAIKVRAVASGDTFEGGLSLDDFETGLAVPAVETGTLNRSAALLMQAGFNSRLAAIKAVDDTKATFETRYELTAWLASEEVVALSEKADWPTEETAEIWRTFLATFTPPDQSRWNVLNFSDQVIWESQDRRLEAGSPVRIVSSPVDGSSLVLTPDYELLGTLANALNQTRKGVTRAIVGADRDSVDIEYVGPADVAPAQLTGA